MRERLERLTLAVGKLPLHDKFSQEIDLHQARHDALIGAEVEMRRLCQLQMTEAIAALEKLVEPAEAELAQIGYDQERHRRLEAVRDDAFRLRSERDRLIAALRQAEQDEARAEQAELAAGQAGARKRPGTQGPAAGPAKIQRG